MAKTAQALVDEYTSADQELATHYQYCPDQREQYGCDECSRLNMRVSRAKRAMHADPYAKELYNSPVEQQKRRTFNREYLTLAQEREYAYDD